MNCNFGFVGVGNMASAIINSILSLDYIKPQQIFIFDPLSERMSDFSKRGINICDSSNSVAEQSDFVFICVKPQMYKEVAGQLNPSINETKCIVSIMAGIEIKTIKDSFDKEPSVIRIMPNTPLMLGEGASALCRDTVVDDERFNVIFDIFSSCGKAVEVNEDKISAVTAISGSGPAYFFKFARAAVEQGVDLGLSYEDSLKLFCQTMRGSAEMLEHSGKSPDELITMVTSPKGTTLAANISFDKNSFEPIVKEAIKACYDRAVELSRQ